MISARDREIARKTLEDAADDWQTGEWADAPRHADRITERLANAQYVTDWLRTRARTYIPDTDARQQE